MCFVSPAICLDMNMCQKNKLENKIELSTLIYIYYTVITYYFHNKLYPFTYICKDLNCNLNTDLYNLKLSWQLNAVKLSQTSSCIRDAIWLLTQESFIEFRPLLGFVKNVDQTGPKLAHIRH